MHALAPFRVRSFRFQWPADLAVSWAFEMEALILGWYVLVATGSVKMLVLYGAVQWTGALFSPLFGVAGDRFGHRRILCATRAIYALLAGTLTVLALGGMLAPWHVFAIALLVGLIRPSDMVMRQALIAQVVPREHLLGALALSRTTADSARVAGSLAGAGSVALFGMGPAYLVVTALYAASFVLSLRIVAPHAAAATPATPLRDLLDGVAYVWTKPALLGAVSLAFLVNLLAFPFFMGLLPYIAKDIYGVGQAGFGYLAATFAAGGLAGSILLGSQRMPLPAGRTMLVAAVLWFACVIAVGQTTGFAAGLMLMAAAGLVHNFCLMPLAAVILRGAEPQLRGRVMGMRILAVWGLPLGLLAAGPAIESLGFAASATLYGVLGLALVLAIAVVWRRALWSRGAAANART
ncbi:MAG: MFS transporter [Burkholderiales bacterium]|nr:MFS transporter [Burkholderiales bacterium]